MRTKPRKLGLLGGITWHSSIDYERALNEGVNEQLGGSSSADLIVRSYDFQQIANAQAAGEWDGLAATFAKDARALESAGAEAILICANTMHLVAPQVQAAIGIPLIHMLDVTADAMIAAGVTRAALLGTGYTNWNPSEESAELLEARAGEVALLQLNRPQVRNALDANLLVALTAAMERLDRDSAVHVLLITGGDRFFAAGADIASMAQATAAEMSTRPQLGCWQRLHKIRKPIVAAVNGYALGGGAELVWFCDLVVAGETSRFGQPEIALGLIPGGGGTQRLPRSVGKARAMEMVLMGEPIAAWDALELGLVNRVAPDELVLSLALRLATQIAATSPDATTSAKSAVLAAFDLPLSAGLNAERAGFNALFDTAGAHEGIIAFLEKRKPDFRRNRS